jgi:hypothetical protein
MFTTSDYTYITKYVAGLDNYLNRTLPLNASVSDFNTLINLLNVTDNLLRLAPNVNGVPRFDTLLSGLYNRINNASINLTSDVRNMIISFLTDILQNSVGLSGFDPLAFLTNYAGDQNLTNTNFGSATVASNRIVDINLIVARSSRVLFAKEVYNRFLASGVNPATSIVNMASPSAYITKDVSAALPTNAKFQLSFVRDSRLYNQPGQTVINSQIISLVAKGQGNATYTFPPGVTAINITIPWVYVPFKLANATNYTSCVVNTYNNNSWTPSTTCKVSANSNQGNAYVVCSEFSTIGVSCKNARVDPSIFITNNTNSNSAFFSVALL